MRPIPMVFAASLLVLSPQAPKPISLAPANASSDEEFTFVSSLRELRDGRVLVSDPQERGLVVLDFGTGKAEPIGRKGQGPGEYSMAGPLRPLGGDSTLMADLLGRRWLILDGTRIAATLPQDDPGVAAAHGMAIGSDLKGHVIATAGRQVGRGVTVMGKGDSTSLVLVSRGSGRVDTLTKLRSAPSQISTSIGGDGKVKGVNISRPPMTVGEEAYLFPDGWIAVARLDPYRVDWRAPDGRWTLGKPLPVPLVPVDQREKRAFMQRSAKASGEPVKPVESVADWPGYIAPFQSNQLFGTRDGRLVILRQRSADHREGRYDIVDRRGALVGVLVLSEGQRLAGFGAASAYSVVTDDDGIQRLRRHPWPGR